MEPNAISSLALRVSRKHTHKEMKKAEMWRETATDPCGQVRVRGRHGSAPRQDLKRLLILNGKPTSGSRWRHRGHFSLDVRPAKRVL